MVLVPVSCKMSWTSVHSSSGTLSIRSNLLNLFVTSKITQPGDLAKGLRTPKEFDFGCKWDLITELPQDWGNRLLEGTNKTLHASEPRKKEQWPHKRLTQTCLWAFRSLQQRRGLAVACCSVWDTEWGSAWTGPFEEGHHYLHNLHHSLVFGQTPGRVQRFCEDL